MCNLLPMYILHESGRKKSAWFIVIQISMRTYEIFIRAEIFVYYVLISGYVDYL